MDLHILSNNLRRLRSVKNKSQVEVAEEAGISRAGYRNIEAGIVAPRVDSLMKIAAVLGVKVEAILATTRSLKAVRFRSNRKMNTREELLIDTARWLDDYNGLEAILGETAEFKFETTKKEISRIPPGPERAKKAAALARKNVGIGEGETIRDICGLLEDNGVKVFTPKLASEGFFGLSVAKEDGGPAIVVNTWERLSVERWIYTGAHELGHLLLHLNAFDVSQSEEDSAQEKEADAFAGFFLMPDHIFDAEYNEAIGLSLVRLVFKLKRIFRVSWKSVLYRIVLKTNDQKLWGRFQAQYKAITGKTIGSTEEPHGLSPDEFSVRPSARIAEEPEHLLEDDFVRDRLQRLVRKAIKQEKITMGRAAEILRIDLETMRDLANSWVE